ncbi:MAG: hypothetical protein KDA57_21980 [Planctomycetales bacterium]|nr:hypothetical protein [Planctomycetales bacterium]
MNSLVIRYSLAAALFLSVVTLAAQQVPSVDDLVNQTLQKMEQDTLLSGDIPEPPVADTALLREYEEVYRSLYNSLEKGFQHRTTVFQWQLLSSKIVFFSVLILLLVGIVFSGIQFRKGLQTEGSMATELEASTSGVKVSSPVLGVIILLISLLFFYLYLVYIYPIHVVY